ncbi:MAG TPA: thioredoxin family protein [Gaiellaceae bacterium]|nr:thioredoxin family protein [Gaiellaceae bacterium]
MTSAVPQPVAPAVAKPKLIFFYSPLSGRCRRAEGFLAQVLQRRHNHETFDLVRVSVEKRPDLAQRFRIEALPTLLVVEARRVKGRMVAPSGCRELERFLRPWLR